MSTEDIPDILLGQNGYKPNDHSLPTLVDLSRTFTSLVNGSPPNTPHFHNLSSLISPQSIDKTKGRTILFVLIDALGQNLIDKLPDSSPLRKYWTQNARAVFPSITASCLTSFFTGQYPSTHGLVGRTFLPSRSVLINPLSWKTCASRESLDDLGISTTEVFCCPNSLPSDTHFFLPKGMGNRQIQVVSSPSSTDNPPSHHLSLNTHPKIVHYETLSSSVAQLAPLTKAFATEENAGKSHLVYFYDGNVDDHTHHFGVYSPEVAADIKSVEEFLISAEQTLFNTTIVLTADHGQTDIPHSAHFDWDWPKDEDPAVQKEKDRLADMLVYAKEGGDRRFSTFHCKEGRSEEFRVGFDALFGEHFVLVPPSEIDRMRLLGPEPLETRTSQILGDWVCFPKNCANVGWGHCYYVATHSGMSKDEMLTPLVILHSLN
ncbi:putative alkaline phosphatase family protein [Blattamonas nauphoetae]|uniref:Alkaline phosphatase family protein n=1 Tax=Blattamonas nauphoetae TaxID=2049346 RepID=A0ABQ9XL13_9EUKA|nr:putative alkaline phosphatase family protein [Blattamonas nauphoetae]